MQSIPWRSTCQLRNQLFNSVQFVQFHSTPVSFAKWKSKWDCKHDRRDQKPSKSYMRYAARQKRAETKKALNDYLLYGKPSPLICKDEDMNSNNNSSEIPRIRSFGKSRFHNSSKSRNGSAWQNKHWFSGFQEEEEEYVNHESIFEAMFRNSHGFTWSYSSWENFCNSRSSNPTNSSRFTNESRRKRAKEKSYLSESDADESDSTSKTFVGSSANRAVLELPMTGALKLHDVKIAFRAAALKWHPDRHAGPSQATAAEKFNLCVNAYQSLCSDLQAS
ncbi:Chaperone DnaJ-domain superfamily protein [Rhynchospora pubera]|uniref:Chaperone DnaJ-domain superfamily protein n=1 Tax=Rhynchospora pubera TaxID=906938 RepID=A0AAV8GK72_9POAL|nr:Chaperone DnaJ-domain superfamily protein [Rhynchospora pubera]